MHFKPRVFPQNIIQSDFLKKKKNQTFQKLSEIKDEISYWKHK